MSIDVEARATGRGAESIGVSALEGRKQLNGMVSMCIFEWCAGVLSAQWAGRVGIKMNRSLDQRSLERSWESAVLGPVSLICVGDSAGKASRHAGKADRGRRICARTGLRRLQFGKRRLSSCKRRNVGGVVHGCYGGNMWFG